jgi:hypothetical protein
MYVFKAHQTSQVTFIYFLKEEAAIFTLHKHIGSSGKRENRGGRSLSRAIMNMGICR